MQEFEENLASSLEEASKENYDQYNVYYHNKDRISRKLEIQNIYNTYLNKILNLRLKENAYEAARKFSKRLVEHITGNYDIGFNSDFETINDDASTLANIVAHTDDIESLENVGSLETIVDGSVAEGLMYEDDFNKGVDLFNKQSGENRTIFVKALNNLTKAHEAITNSIAKFAGFNNNNFNDNIIRKFVGGIAFEFVSGTLFDKRHFTNVVNSNIMLEKIHNEGIIHFTSPETAEKIIESGYIKPSKFLESDMTARKSFFFAGIPKFEDLLINIPGYHVMTAVKINPTAEQVANMKYRPINDGALAYDGKFEFNREFASITYYGLKYNKETNSLYYAEISKEEAKNYVPDKEVSDNYNYSKNNIMDNIKLNAYGFFAEFKHYQKLRQVLKTCKLDTMTDEMLAEARNIEEANMTR